MENWGEAKKGKVGKTGFRRAEPENDQERTGPEPQPAGAARPLPTRGDRLRKENKFGGKVRKGLGKRRYFQSAANYHASLAAAGTQPRS